MENKDFIDLEIEREILSTLLVEPSAITQIVSFVLPEYFANPDNALIYEACFELFRDNAKITHLTVFNRLKSKVENPQKTLKTITDLRQNTFGNIEAHGRILQNNAIRRKIQDFAYSLFLKSQDRAEETLKLLGQMNKECNAITSEISISSNKTFAEQARETLEEIIKHQQLQAERQANGNHEAIIGLSCGLREVDYYTGGFKPSELVILAARPSVGKTGFALNIILRNLLLGKNVVFFSIEMSEKPIIKRLISIATEINLHLIEQGLVDNREISDIETFISEATATNFLLDTKSIKVESIYSVAHSAHQKQPVDLIVIDYLQMVQSLERHGTKDIEIGLITAKLKSLAKELNVPIIVLSALSRQAEQERPGLKHLRESGAIEFHADLVLMIHSEEKNGVLTYADGSPTKGTSEIIISKNRNGAIGEAKVGFKKETVTFFNL
jgi:replicative DNA helicase